MKPSIWWIKRDIRLHDNDALARALQSSHCVIPLFVFEPDLIAQRDYSALHVYAWQQALVDLRASLREIGSDVYIASVDIETVLVDLRRQIDFGAIFSHEETGNDWTYQRDKRVAQWCDDSGIDWQELPQNAVIRRLKNRDQRQPVFRQRLIESAVLRAPRSVPLPAAIEEQCSQQTIPDHTDFYSASEYAQVEFGQLQTISETQARHDLHSFLTQRGYGYAGGISSPNTAFESGSRLSAHLAWGTISLRTVHDATIRAQAGFREMGDETGKQWGKSLRAFSSRLHWHDHFIQRLESEPDMEFNAINPAYARMEYEDDPQKLEAWTFGRTGFPLIDACMRCLQATGFLNFRMRAMVVSFAVFGLHLSWRTIHPPLARIFRDYEPGIHLSQLQMQAGVVGINTIRVYSPVKQILDQDPECEFIKRWIPELAEFSAIEIAASDRPRLGQYPDPIVDFKVTSKAMKDQIFSIRKSDAGKLASEAVLEKHGSRKRPSRARR